MSLTKTFLSLLVLFTCISISCEDTQSKKNKTTTTEAKTLKKDTAVVDSNPKTTAINKDSVTTKKEEPFKITNDNLIDFFTQYGKENQETIVRIKTRLGSFDIQLFEETPIHRANFIYLVKQKYFDETFFYRVSKGFVIQGGNSDRTEMSKKRFEIGDYTIPQEQLKGVQHDRGMVALSKQWVDNPSNRSTPYEFFVVVAQNGAHHLDGEHTIFGKVIRGMSTVDKISNVPVDGSEWPKENIFITAEVIK
ncbi:peptidylprolyl isomerase [Aquimarina brevivitae]|uniref:Peptidyl-prolyl cis-trans isomerase n=1 Tax=Aquimarina brevivitae TaxID=323412 RepID=A0A4Q7P0L3_9FLAO|nr:peptidylprolyl isomerase [Aquimarina brevivitae]RZS93331.1 cyclophilin family peptidyl-prolyl cis-trans isomerase [Aquimarina brevivitae]